MSENRTLKGRTQRAAKSLARLVNNITSVSKPAGPESVEVLVSDFATAKPPVIDIPAMICQPEKNYYFWLTSNLASGVGAVVEFGTWLGASSAHLSAGLRGQAMHCYDHFIWSDYYNSKSGLQLEDGADFSSIFLSNMERHSANVIVHQEKMADIAWSGGPIELLILDAPKQATDLAKLLTVFGPSLIPGRTRIALQDYQHFPSYQISVVMDALRATLTLEHVVVAKSGNLQPNTVAFLALKAIDLAALTEVIDTFKTWSVERIQETWARIMRPLPQQVQARMAPGLALFLFDADHKDEALAALKNTAMDRLMLKRWKRVASRISGRYPLLFSGLEEKMDLDAQLQERLAEANSIKRDVDPKRYIAAWKNILAVDSHNLLAANNVVSAAKWSDDRSELVDGLIAILDITPNDLAVRDRLVNAGLHAKQEQKVLDCLARHGLVDLGSPRMESLQKRVYKMCQNAVRNENIPLALSCFRTLARADRAHFWIVALQSSLVKKLVSVAGRLGDQSELVEGLIAILEIVPDDRSIQDRLIRAALKGHQEQKALDYLARHGLADLSSPRIESLHKRVYMVCQNALRAGDIDLAFPYFQTLALVDDRHPWVEALRPSLAKKIASAAKEAEKQGDLVTAVPLAEQSLQIVPDQPVALAVFARDMLRHRRFNAVIKLCTPRIQPGSQYDSVRKIMERATAKISA